MMGHMGQCWAFGYWLLTRAYHCFECGARVKLRLRWRGWLQLLQGGSA